MRLTWTLLLWALPLHAATTDPTLEFSVAQKTVLTATVSELKKEIGSEIITLENEFTGGKSKRYRVFRLHALLDLAFGKAWRETAEFSEMIFSALDGYESVGALDIVRVSGGYVAFEDLDVPGWEKIGRKKADPAPFFLVWTGTKQTTAESYPWPWQLARIGLVRFADQFPRIVPIGADPEKDGAVFRGFNIFKSQCVRCHSMDQQGGKIGPDLNAPKNVLEYRDEEMVREFIYNPSKYRYTNMPDHQHFSDHELDELIAYLYFMGKRPKSKSDFE